MPDLQQLNRRIVHTAQHSVVNPVGRRSPTPNRIDLN
jgi:hypothetical protein